MEYFNSMDAETASLIIQLQLEDSATLSSSLSNKGKGIEGVLTDTQLALQLYREELQRNATTIADRCMTRSLARACQTDGNLLASTFSEEQREARDRQVALRLGGVNPPRALTEGPADGAAVVEEEELDDEVLEKLNALYICAAGEDSDSGEYDGSGSRSGDEDDSRALVPYHSTSGASAETSRWAMSRTTQGTKRHCTACRERYRFCELSHVPCGHEYCRLCLRELFNASMTDDTLFPPRCCRRPITPSSAINIHLTPSIVRLYEAKKVEFDTLDRTYCSNPLCSSFIRMEFVSMSEGRATCQVCETVTCTICKGAAHGGDCPEDEALNLVLQIARDNQWQRCYNCHRLVELDTGCYHMTCTCSAQFCYVCGEPWKTCTCQSWEVYRLRARAEVVTARQPAAAVEQPPAQRRARFAAILDDLVNRHECDHDAWRWVRGPNECEECRHDLPSYIFECRQCHLQACNRCRRNRL